MRIYLIEDYDFPYERKMKTTVVAGKLHDMLDDLVGGSAKFEIHDEMDAAVKQDIAGGTWIGKGMLFWIFEAE